MCGLSTLNPSSYG